MLRLVGAAVALIALLIVGRFAYLSMTARPPQNLGPAAERLAPCPDRPNCVSSQARRDSQKVEPLVVDGDPATALARAASAIESMPRARVVASGDGYLHAEYRSAIFRFVDDLELLHDPAVPGFQVRSASRVGHSDVGANRKRVEALRSLLE